MRIVSTPWLFGVVLSLTAAAILFAIAIRFFSGEKPPSIFKS
jgi:hypothetical protein